MCDLGHTILLANRLSLQIGNVSQACTESARAPRGPPERARLLVSAARAAGGATCTSARCAIFDGPAPAYDDLVGHRRRAAAPRSALPPAARIGAARSRDVRCGWTIRSSVSPSICVIRRCRARETTRSCAGWPARIFSQALDRGRPLWELWLIEGLSDGRFALLSKTHHALVDGVSGVDIASVIFDSSADPQPVAPPPRPWRRARCPSAAQLLADALVERATVPGEAVAGHQIARAGPA